MCYPGCCVGVLNSVGGNKQATFSVCEDFVLVSRRQFHLTMIFRTTHSKILINTTFLNEEHEKNGKESTFVDSLMEEPKSGERRNVHHGQLKNAFSDVSTCQDTNQIEAESLS
ncbi:uncharacterized protein PS065_020116 [Dugong dugon]